MATPSRPPKNNTPAWLTIGSQVLGLVVVLGAAVLIIMTVLNRDGSSGLGGSAFSTIASGLVPDPEATAPGGELYPVETSVPPLIETPPPTEVPPPTEIPQPTATAIVWEPMTGDVIKIAIDLPISGVDAADGLPTLNGMELAIRQANEKGGVTINGKTYRLETYVLDDVPPGGQMHDPAQGAKNADAFIFDPSVMVMLGPFNSNVARAMTPKLNLVGLCNISPSNTREQLTKPEYGETQIYRPTGRVTYFRVVATDDLQGPASADYAFNKLAFKKVYILDDTESYGKGIADGFEKRFREIGGEVLGHESVRRGTTDYSSILNKIAGMNPDFLYYGGTSSNNIPLARKQMKAFGLNVPLMGGDGIVDLEFTKVAGMDAEDSYGSVAAVNVKVLPEAQQFIADYNNAGFDMELGAYSGPGYEAANIAIDALTRAKSVDREAVCQALRETKGYKGITGETNFDENGDTTNRIISFYQVRDGKWEFVDQIRYEDMPKKQK